MKKMYLVVIGILVLFSPLALGQDYTFTLDWSAFTGDYAYQLYPGLTLDGTEYRACAYHKTSNKMIITIGKETAPPVRGVVVIDPDTGAYLWQLSLTTVDSNDLDSDGNTAETSSWDGALGPYPVSSNGTHTEFFVAPFKFSPYIGRFTGTDAGAVSA